PRTPTDKGSPFRIVNVLVYVTPKAAEDPGSPNPSRRGRLQSGSSRGALNILRFGVNSGCVSAKSEFGSPDGETTGCGFPHRKSPERISPGCKMLIV
ncbi:MAG TPA: hypothetical protein PLX59_06635, partial [Candidatus Cloacimonadota bacterium]|nr:hypothetical protein [Candidatus Cloacimonadota bacterium]